MNFQSEAMIKRFNSWFDEVNAALSSIGMNQNDWQARFGTVQLANKLQSAQTGHFQIGDDHMEFPLSRAGQSFVAARLGGERMAFVREHPAQCFRNTGVVFDQENMA